MRSGWVVVTNEEALANVLSSHKTQSWTYWLDLVVCRGHNLWSEGECVAEDISAGTLCCDVGRRTQGGE